jgi:hypothetical protein
VCKNYFLRTAKYKGVETANCTKEKCTRRSALIAAKNAKYHSNPTKTDLSTAKNVGQKEDPQEEADIKLTS